MRVTFIFIIVFVILGAFLGLTLEGIMLLIGCAVVALYLVITVAYPDTMLLFLLGARELRSIDEENFFQAASQESYKLSVKMPKLYFYNGSLERAFIFQGHGKLSIVISKNLLEKARPEELKAICFELLLQVKKGMASKRTKSMFFLGTLVWSVHSLISLFTAFIPFKDVRKSADWFVNYFFNPVLEFLFKIIVGEAYFKKLSLFINEFPDEKEHLERLGLKLRKPYSYYSLASRKILELQAVNRSKHFQNIMALEFLPHEWDFMFSGVELKGA